MSLLEIVKIGIVIFLIIWTIIGYLLVKNYGRIFGPHADDPAETEGARSFGVAHIVAIWIGGTALGLYFLLR